MIHKKYVVIIGISAVIFLGALFVPEVWAQRLPGSDVSDKMEAAGTVLRLLDTALFQWGAKIFAGLCVMSAGWALKEQRFGVAVISIIGAIMFGTATTWVKNIFDMSSANSIFSGVFLLPFLLSFKSKVRFQGEYNA